MFLHPRKCTTAFHGYGIEFSPFQETLFTVATSQHFGIVGNGEQCVFECLPNGDQVLLKCFRSNEGIYDCAWNEMNCNQIVSGCANGSVKIWDCSVAEDDSRPIWISHEHQEEISTVSWNPTSKHTFLTSSWDSSIKLYDPHQSRTSIQTFTHDASCVYAAIWHPHESSQFSSCTENQSLAIWDTSERPGGRAAQHCPGAHERAILTLDWNKYKSFELVTGSVDRLIKVWDTRKFVRPAQVLAGHDFGIRRVKCSPHDAHVIASVSYDMSMGLWNSGSGLSGQSSLMRRSDHHSEFVFGLDFSLFTEGLVATCSWDRQTMIWNSLGQFPDPAPALLRYQEKQLSGSGQRM